MARSKETFVASTLAAAGSGVGSYMFLRFINNNKSSSYMFLNFCCKHPWMSQTFAAFGAAAFVGALSTIMSGEANRNATTALLAGTFLAFWFCTFLIGQKLGKGLYNWFMRDTLDLSLIANINNFFIETSYALGIIGTTTAVGFAPEILNKVTSNNSQSY